MINYLIIHILFSMFCILYFNSSFSGTIINKNNLRTYNLNIKNFKDFIQFCIIITLNDYFIKFTIKEINYNFRHLLLFFMYFYIFTLINDIHFYLWHRAMHLNKYLYKSIHHQHHLNKYVIASDFLDQTFLELFISILPMFYVYSIFNFIPSYIHFLISRIVLINGFIGHSNYDISKYKTRYILMIILFPFIIMNYITTKLFKKSYILNMKHHHLHHIKYKYNYSQTYKIIDIFFNTYKS